MVTNSETIKLAVKFPNGNRSTRNFRVSDTLNLLFMFTFHNEDCPLNFEISTNFPVKVIKCDERTSTSFQDIGITQSTVLFVIDKDA